MKKKLMAVALATIIAVMAIAGASLAWLKDTTGPVTNTFTEGKVDIDLYETENGEHVMSKTYKMVPGATFDKDPTVDVIKDSEACWLFVKIEELNNIDTFLQYNYITGDDGWTLLNESIIDGVPTIIIYRQVSAADAANGKSYQILTDNKVSVNTSVEMSDMKGLSSANYPQLKFTAYAIQSDFIVDQNSDSVVDAKDAWALIGAN